MSVTLLAGIFTGAAIGGLIPAAALRRVVAQQETPAAQKEAAKVARLAVGASTIMGALMGCMAGSLIETNAMLGRMNDQLAQMPDKIIGAPSCAQHTPQQITTTPLIKAPRIKAPCP